MVAQTTDWLRKKSHGLTSNEVKTLAQALLLGARLLRIPGAATNSKAENLKAMLTEAPPAESAAEDNDPWSKIREQARAQRPAMLSKLKLFVVARQGGADKINAVDAAAMLPAIEELRTSKTLPNEAEVGAFDATVNAHLRQLKGPLKAAADHRATKLGEWHAKVTAFLGNNFEISDVIEQLREAITEANRAHVYQQTDLQAASLSAKLGDLQQLKIKPALELARSTADATDLAVQINNIAQVDGRVEAGVLATLDQYHDFLEQTSREVDGRLNSLPPTPAEQGKRLAGIVAEIEKTWSALETTK
jgi:hypothetical protein